jgi:CRP-like cAMP-binding protein
MADEINLDDLLHLEPFSVFETTALHELLMGAETRLLRAGDVLFRRGDASDGGFLLTSGSAAIESRDPAKPAEKILRPLALLGETALIASTTRPITALAREPSAVLKISRALVHQTLERHPATAARVRQLFRDRLMRLAENLHMSADET